MCGEAVVGFAVSMVTMGFDICCCLAAVRDLRCLFAGKSDCVCVYI